MSWNDWAAKELNSIRETHRFRALYEFDGTGCQGAVDRQPVISFASNDYLGLSAHPRVRSAAIDAIVRFGAGVTASRLVVGTRNLHSQLEAALASWQHTEAALVFSSGYAANIAALTVFGADDATIFSDELNHASIIDGCRLSRAETVVYRHRDVEHLATLMKKYPGRKVIVSDTVFSMDGDVAPLADIASLCRHYGSLLILDEAHAVLEPIHEYPDVQVLRTGTLSKTLGSMGGWVAGTRELIDLLINRARPFIFTTGLSPADTAAALAALGIFTREEGVERRAHLRRMIQLMRPDHPSPILPIIIGEANTAVAAAEFLFRHGLHVPAIRPPTVPAHTSRLRVSFSAEHTVAMVELLKRQLALLPLQ